MIEIDIDAGIDLIGVEFKTGFVFSASISIEQLVDTAGHTSN
jgi:hypothetical protein